MPTLEELSLDISQSIEIKSALGTAYRSLMRRISDENVTADNKPMPMVLEEWPGGRWFRDLGNGQGHFWGLVQVIKPPTLLEITGPMFMSYAVAGHLQFRLMQIPGGVELSMRHRILGMVEEQHRRGVRAGWNAILERVKTASERSPL
jgi:hypothetical protein